MRGGSAFASDTQCSVRGCLRMTHRASQVTGGASGSEAVPLQCGCRALRWMRGVHGFERAVPMLMRRAICSARKAKSLAREAIGFGRKAKRFVRKVLVLCVQGSELGAQGFFSDLMYQKGLHARRQARSTKP